MLDGYASRDRAPGYKHPALSLPSCVSKNSVNVDAASAGPERKPTGKLT